MIRNLIKTTLNEISVILSYYVRRSSVAHLSLISQIIWENWQINLKKIKTLTYNISKYVYFYSAPTDFCSNDQNVYYIYLIFQGNK